MEHTLLACALEAVQLVGGGYREVEGEARCRRLRPLFAGAHAGRTGRFYDTHLLPAATKIREAFLVCAFNFYLAHELRIDVSCTFEGSDKHYFWEQHMSTTPFVMGTSCHDMITIMNDQTYVGNEPSCARRPTAV